MPYDRFLQSPDYFLCAFEGRDAVFLQMDRAAYYSSVFMDARAKPKDPTPIRVDFETLYEHFSITAAKGSTPHYIFHVAHCGSTLLARALDDFDANIVYREPFALRQLGVVAASSFGGNFPAADQKRLHLLQFLLSRTYAPENPAIVKANVPVNFLIPELHTLTPAAQSIVLYFPLEHYVLAVSRTVNHRNWVTSVSTELSPAITAITNRTQTAADAVALLWYSQMRMFSDLLAKNPNARSLNAEDFFQRPGEVITAAAQHFGQPKTAEAVNAIVASPLFSTYSKKQGIAFSNEIRLERRKATMIEAESLIIAARLTVEKLIEVSPLPEALSRPLLGRSDPLLARVDS